MCLVLKMHLHECTTAAKTHFSSINAGHVALVTGGGSGIGLSISRELLRHGSRVLIMGRRGESRPISEAEID